MKKGFTLIELLVVIAILGILAVVGVGAFRSSQMKGRDAQRKSDLKQIANSLEFFYADHKAYPNASGTMIAGCPSTTDGSCDWGIEQFTDTDTVYFKTVPKDPSDTTYYVYQVNTGNNKYKLLTRLENGNDKQCVKATANLQGTDPNCLNPLTVTCGPGASDFCNYAVTSTNVSVLDTLD